MNFNTSPRRPSDPCMVIIYLFIALVIVVAVGSSVAAALH